MPASRARRRPGEFVLIDRYFSPLATDGGAFGLKDDAAIYRARPGEDIVVTADTVVESVHFLPGDSPAAVSRKALRVNLSDLAAKGATPFGYLLSLALPAGWTEVWVKGFAKGLAADQKRFAVSLLGGDTTQASGGVTVAITALGRVPKGEMVLRSGARPGDGVFVSGTIGDGALGLRIRRGKLSGRAKGAKHLLDRYLTPQPRTTLAPVLRRYASAAIDVSDGLVGDLGHICDVSGVGAEIEARLVPLSSAAKAALAGDSSLLSLILNGGDDYEIVATVPESREAQFVGAAKAVRVAVTRIGTIVAGNGPPVVRDASGHAIRLGTKSHTHF